VSAIETHIVVTPTRNEGENLRRLAASLVDQSWRPKAWLVVDDGSTDDTQDVICSLTEEHDWIRSLRSRGGPHVPRIGGIRGFNAGVATLELDSGLISNVDADVSYEPDYFERIRDEFERRPKLGIAGGLSYELKQGAWSPIHVTDSNPRGPSRTYRAECLAQLAPLDERPLWDAIDSVRANARGWETATIPTAGYFHHRATSSREGNRFAAWTVEGAAAHYMWYRPSYLIARTSYRVAARRDLAATGMMWGYARSTMRREQRHAEPGFKEVIRQRQSLRGWPSRFREVSATAPEPAARPTDAAPPVAGAGRTDEPSPESVR
jgi:glycosyltransferase involved in cell wall biosynthesis